MCGIAGLVAKREYNNLENQLRAMTKLVAHRGPDGEGIYCFQNVGLGHRRLSIVDLSKNGYQPMHYLDKQLTITYNGEIYNYPELRKELESLGYTFHSHTDTEVILAAYAEWGEGCVKFFNGMWAFAIYDKFKQIIFCSRDRFGIKPFYYMNTPSLWAFGSEIKQLLPHLCKVSANGSLIIDFIFTSMADHKQQTFFKEVTKIPAGHNLTYCLKNHNFTLRSYYKVCFNPAFSELSSSEAIDAYIHLLEDAVKLRLRADVRVGTCLSGGLDSSTVASIAAPVYLSRSGHTFCGITAVSEQACNNEAAYAREVIRYHNMQWLQVCPTYADFIDSLPQVVRVQEEPFGGPSIIMQYLVMKEARDNGISVLLDGQGGDETLLGYDKYYASHLATTFQIQGFFPFMKVFHEAGKNNKRLTLLNLMKYFIAGASASARYQYYCHQHRYLLRRPDCPEHLAAFSRVIWNLFEMQCLEIEQTNLPVLLRYEDKNSMAHAVETRLPFLDYRVLEAALSLPGHFKIRDGWSKWLLRKGMENRMPKAIAWRKDKIGFEAPEKLWLSKHFDDMYTSVCASPMMKDITKQHELKRSFDRLDKRTQWRLYSIALWEKTFGVSI